MAYTVEQANAMLDVKFFFSQMQKHIWNEIKMAVKTANTRAVNGMVTHDENLQVQSHARAIMRHVGVILDGLQVSGTMTSEELQKLREEIRQYIVANTLPTGFNLSTWI